MNRKKSLITAILLVLLLTFAVSGTIAYLVTSTDPVTNTFTPAKVDTDIVETFDNNEKQNVYVTNSSDSIEVYIRAKVVANWYKDGEIVAAWDDNISYNTVGWTKKGEYWYYNSKVAAGGKTTNLFDSYTYNSADVPVAGAHLEMTIIHQSIQAEPTSAVQEAWGYVPGSSADE